LIIKSLPPFIKFSQAVESALTEGLPVLALESTVITHGLPFPQNIEIAKVLEQTALENGTIPATIAVIDGTIHIGLEEAELDRLAELSLQAQTSPNLLKKLAKRDIPLALAEKSSGGTTVSATLYLAHLAGIKVFATGGIGGVHKNWQDSLDWSADLPALAQHPVIVVTAGCKAILDIPATLEQLETLSIPVYGWQTHFCPAFYTRESVYPIERIDKVDIITEAYQTHLALSSESDHHNSASALLIMNPIPEQYSLDSDVIEPAIEQAVNEARQLNIKGKAITPWLLKKLADVTKGKSIEANLALLKNNVVLGSQIAQAICS
jgi:pseudouridine-5'-phosphate glycosidase